MRFRFLAALAFVLAALAPSTGCVLVVPEIQYGDHCTFDGSSACATCLKTSCQTAIDACCGDSTCNGGDGHSSMLDALDTCGGGDQAGCASGLGEATSGTGGAMRSCVTTTCKDVCVGTQATPVKWSCDSPPSNDNACATCVYGKCSSAISACCTDTSTGCKDNSELKDDVGRCVGGDAPGCSYSTITSSGYPGAVRGCITKNCAAACLGDGRTHESCTLEGSGSYCTCSSAAKSSGMTCSMASPVAGGTCVLGSAGCTCGHYTCQSGSLDDCNCDFQGGDDSSQTCSVDRSSGSSTGVCCLKLGSASVACSCTRFADMCNDNEAKVDSCDLTVVSDYLATNGTSLVVTSCSY